jgi:hypothetical protein
VRANKPYNRGVADDFELFAQLHLGILPDGSALEQSVPEVARRAGLDVDALQARLREAQIDLATVDDTDYDVSGQHSEAQVLALLGDAGATLAFAKKVYGEYRARLGHKRARVEDFQDKTLSDKIEISDVPRRR